MRSLRMRVRYGETDKMGVVYHPNFFRFFELGRTEYLRDAGLAYAELERRGFLLVVTEAAARFHANVGYDEEIVIRTTVHSMGRASLRFVYAVEDAAGRLLCDGSTELACVEAARRRPARLPPDVVSLLRSTQGHPTGFSSNMNESVT
ncbi:MAG: acyl-CoA thioesterase [Planctomycetes bacterium]|nr:acyl-CoA thioesterase [Planctomycetota bacterium]